MHDSGTQYCGTPVLGCCWLLFWTINSAPVAAANLAQAVEHPRLRLCKVELATEDLDELVADADTVFHLAAVPGVRSSWGARFGDCVTALTGVPVLINTSLNVTGKPICGTPEMALDCLVGSGLDALMMEGWWITK